MGSDEEMLRLIKDTALPLAAPRPLKCFFFTLGNLSKTAVCCLGLTGVQFGALGAGDNGPHAGLGGHPGHRVDLWTSKVILSPFTTNEKLSHNCIFTRAKEPSP